MCNAYPKTHIEIPPREEDQPVVCRRLACVNIIVFSGCSSCARHQIDYEVFECAKPATAVDLAVWFKAIQARQCACGNVGPLTAPVTIGSGTFGEKGATHTTHTRTQRMSGSLFARRAQTGNMIAQFNKLACPEWACLFADNVTSHLVASEPRQTSSSTTHECALRCVDVVRPPSATRSFRNERLFIRRSECA